MSAIRIHLGHTELAVDQSFGTFTVEVSRLKQPPFALPFRSAVEASQFVAAMQAGMAEEDRDWEARKPGTSLPKTEETPGAEELLL